MIDLNRPTIGFLTCHLDNDYAFEICKGVEYAAEEADVNLVIMPGMFLNASYNDPINAKYDYQYNSIFHYATKKSLDALIISIGSIGSFLSVNDKKTFIDSFDMPIITIEAEIPGYPYLYTESRTGMSEAIRHLIIDHGKTKIGFVSGRLENADALERFNVYKEILAENGIPYEEKRVAYGNFSEFTEDIVDELLNNNPDLEAIVFANDTMAIGGYKSVKKRGLVVGKDILIVGYDNSPCALELEPQLTTVDNNIMDLGYNSVYQALEILKTGKNSTSLLKSRLVKRLSCGCNPSHNSEVIDDINNNLSSYTSDDVIRLFKENYMEQHSNNFYSKDLFAVLDPYLKIFIDALFDDKDFDNDELKTKTEKLMENSIIKYYYSHSKITYLINTLSNFLLNIDIPNERHFRLEAMFNAVLSFLSFYISKEYVTEVKSNKEKVWQSMRMTRDTLLNSTDDRACYTLIAENLYNHCGFQSAFLYLYDELPVLKNDGLWRIPKYIHLQAFVKDGVPVYLSEDQRILPSYMIFNHKYTPNDRRHTMVLTPLLTNEVQHGLLLCETDLSNFNRIYSTSIQLGTSLKFLSLMKQEMAIQDRLEQTMNEIRDKNDQLNAISVTDELTGLYNRRGYFETVQIAKQRKEFSGKHGLIGYIDMDNLKQVNDQFGHKDGDFALISISNTLRKSFPRGTIIARIGGDEFAIFTPDMTGHTIEDITNSLKTCQERVNEQSGKPYYIEFSIGLKSIICNNILDIEAEMSDADKELYKAKQNKRKIVAKQPSPQNAHISQGNSSSD